MTDFRVETDSLGEVAGSAGIGIANLITTAMTLEGLSTEQAQAQISMFDVNGLLTPSRKDLFDSQKPYAHPHQPTKDFVRGNQIAQANCHHWSEYRGQSLQSASR